MSKVRKGWEYSLQIKGVIGRTRKPTTHYFTLIETDTTESIPVAALKGLVARKLVDVAYKYGNVSVVAYPTTIEAVVSRGGKASRAKIVEVMNGNVVWSAPGFNMPPKDK
jgi:hypothetical protein